MTLFKDVKKEYIKNNTFFKCDSCKEKISSNDIKFVDPSDNIEILTPLIPFIFVNKNGKIIGGSKMANKSIGDKLFACPYCNNVHLFGFDLWND